MTILTAQQRADRAISERDFQRQVTELALMFGWDWAHFRPAQTSRGWRTPVSGTIGEGWPDAQLRVLDTLRALEWPPFRVPSMEVPGILRLEVHVWQPSDLTSGQIQAVLS